MIEQKFAFLILAHQEPKQLARLINHLKDPRINIYIHIDSRVAIEPFKEQLKNLEINWVPRYKSQWASRRVLSAILSGIKIIHEDDPHQRVTLLSGMDYPLRPIQEIISFFDHKPATDFIEIINIDKSNWPEDKKLRVKKNYFFARNTIYEYPLPPENRSIGRFLLNLVFWFALKKERPFPDSLEAYGGEMWFSLSSGTIEQVLIFHQERPDLFRFMKRCFASDEIFFQTVIAHLNPNQENIEPPITYVNWPSQTANHPRQLDKSDFLIARRENYLFARKVNPNQNEILDEWDIQLNAVNNLSSTS